MNQCGKAADEVDAHVFGHPVQGFGIFHRISAAGSHQHGNRRHADPLIDDGNSVFLFDELTGLYQIFGVRVNFVVNFFTGPVDVAVTAVQKGDAHGDGPDIQILLLDHGDGLHDVIKIQHPRYLL